MTQLSCLSLGCLVAWVAASAQVVIDPGRPFPGYGSFRTTLHEVGVFNAVWASHLSNGRRVSRAQ